jgi:L-threonylcarbamoyladenylate synthase
VPDVQRAVELLRAGKLVAFPTETVYGLGADARSSDAVRGIFRVKGRPSTNPLIVHVSGVAMAKLYASEWPDTARKLAQRFWPGPLTLVLPRFRTLAPEVSAGLNTVGLRMPNHPLALDLIRAFDGPLAAPSANKSTHVSPTTAQHVRDEFGDAIELILDGGPCEVGIESTVLDLTRNPKPAILRPGGVSREQIEAVIGAIEMPDHLITAPATPASGPGQHEVHYAPVTPGFRMEHLDPAVFDGTSAVIALGHDAQARRVSTLHVQMSCEPARYAHDLYAVLRELDALHPTSIYIEMPPDQPRWSAVRDRLRRAAKPR